MIIRVLLKEADSERPPKSDSLAPLMAMTGCPEPSNFSAWMHQNIEIIFLKNVLFFFFFECKLKHNENTKYEKAQAASSGGRETSLYRTAIVFFFSSFLLLMHLVYPSRSRWKSLCQINKQGTACSLSVGGWGGVANSAQSPRATGKNQLLHSSSLILPGNVGAIFIWMFKK